MLRQSLEDVRRRIHQACQRVGRLHASVELIAVTKTVSVERIREAIALGIAEIGESRIQEARAKQAALGSGLWARGSEPSAPSPQPIRWHLVGHLQRNKAKDAVRLFDVIHSVDSLALLEVLGQQVAAQRLDTPLEILLQVNVSGESSKHGCRPEALEGLAEAAQRTPGLGLLGLMTLPPWTQDPEQSRPHFRRLRELRDRLDAGLKLSMGMSGDFEVAVEEGADFVRIGTAIFGTRDG